VAPVIEHLLSACEAMNSIPSITKKKKKKRKEEEEKERKGKRIVREL
jgi:hypothetical protein